ncbi:MAG: ABC transporter permease [Chelatococcus sp.]|nr:ABC transporter permease [Chelatococcus sp. HY11]MBX3544467.1 ABC transporter permease [Chelatococcus sp.]
MSIEPSLQAILKGAGTVSEQSIPVIRDQSAEISAARWRSLGRAGVIVAVHLAVLLLWQWAVDWFAIPAFILPSPVATLATLGSDQYAWGSNTLVTAAEIFGGYGLAVFIGVALALLFSWSRWLTLIFLPLFVTLNMIPKVALGPLFIVWFSYGIVPNILIAFSICFFPILLTTARGLGEVDPDLLDLVRSLKGTRWQLFRKIQLPGALPYVFSGMKVGAILAVAGAVVGEFIASERGLGYLMIQVQSSLDTPAMLMAVILLTLLGILLYGLVLLLERLVIVRDVRVQ